MKKTLALTITTVGLALTFNSLFAQTINERLAEIGGQFDWTSAEAVALKNDILASSPPDLSNLYGVTVTLISAEKGVAYNLDPDLSGLSAEVVAWIRSAAVLNPQVSDFVAVAIDGDLSQLDSESDGSVVFHWAVLWGDYTFGQVEDYIVGKGMAWRSYQRAFKSYRTGLPLTEQIALTQKEKDGLVAVSSRTSLQDQWLTEISADLMALKLDQ